MWLACASASSGRRRDGSRRTRNEPPRRLVDREPADFNPFVERQRPLAAAGQLAVDFDQNLRVEQRPVLDALRAVDPVAVAQGVEAVGLPGMFPAGQRQRIDHAVHADRVASEPLKLGVEKAHVEFGVVDDEPRVPDESQEVLDDRGERRLVLQQLRRVAMHPYGVLGHVALRVDELVKDASRRRLVDDFDGANLEHPVALRRAETGGFGIEHNFTHGPPCVLPVR